MGGFGSGRKGGRLTVEDGLSLDINRLLRDGLFVPGRRVAGFVRWTDAGTGRELAALGYVADLAAARVHLLLPGRGGALRLGVALAHGYAKPLKLLRVSKSLIALSA